MLPQNQIHCDGNKTLNNHDRNRQAYTLPEMDQRENEYKVEERRKHQDAAKDVLHPKRHHRLNAKDITERHDKWEEAQNAQDQDRLLIRIAHDDVHDGLRQDKSSQRSEKTQSTDITNRLMQKGNRFFSRLLVQSCNMRKDGAGYWAHQAIDGHNQLVCSGIIANDRIIRHDPQNEHITVGIETDKYSRDKDVPALFEFRLYIRPRRHRKDFWRLAIQYHQRNDACYNWCNRLQKCRQTIV